MKMPSKKLNLKDRVAYWLRHFKPIHLCWWFEKHGWRVPKYLIGTSSNYDLTHYVFGTDSGTTDPDTQTFGTEDDPVIDQAKETPFFIRFQVRETGGKAGANNYWQLYYNNTNDPATASQVTTAGDGVVKVIDDPGSNIANQAAADTRVMSEWVGETYGAGEYSDAQDDTNGKYQLDSSATPGYTEFMWCVQFESGAGDAADYYFYPRCNDVVMDSHSVHPKVTTEAAPVIEALSGQSDVTVSVSGGINVTKGLSGGVNVNIATSAALDSSRNYSREQNASLPTDDSDLSINFTFNDYQDVFSDDGNKVSQLLNFGNYALFLFKRRYNEQKSFSVKWNGQSVKAPSESTVFLQVYNRNTPAWETIDSNDSADANTDFDLVGSVHADLGNYYDANKEIACRAYQFL